MEAGGAGRAVLRQLEGQSLMLTGRQHKAGAVSKSLGGHDGPGVAPSSLISLEIGRGGAVCWVVTWER